MSLEPIVRYSRNVEGKITIATVFLCVLVISVFFLIDVQYKDGIKASDVATTSVFVLNSPPEWTTGPAEVPVSSSSTPTNEGDTVTWTGTAYDPNGSNSYWLLICKNTTATETDMTLYDPVGDTPPDCPSGSTWARSALTADTDTATATYQTLEGRVEDEVNDWYAFICDNDSINPRCNVTDVRQGGGESGSPFYVNYRPYFTEFNSPSATDPGDNAIWTTVASNSNTQLSSSGVKLFVCKENDFNESLGECGAGGTYASSSFVASNPSATYTVTVPTPNGNYPAYGFVVDTYGLSAPLSSNSDYDSEDRMQGTSAPFTVNNIAPQLVTDSVSILNHDNDPDYLTLNVPEDETEGFQVSFTTTDNNSCVTNVWESGTTTGFQEMSSVAVNIFRSGVGMGNCVLDADYDANNCYPYAVEEATYEAPAKGWEMFCVRDDSTCSGNSDSDVEWNCTFPLWYLADPTDGATVNDVQYPGEDWLASVVVTDIDSATSTLAQGDTGIDVQSYTAFKLNQNSIAFGELEAGDRNETLDKATPIVAVGNTGVDQDLQGKPMCPGFDTLSAPLFGCTDYDHTDPLDIPADTIPPAFQKFAEGTATAYGSGTTLRDVNYGDYVNLELNVLKSTTVLTPQSKDIGWGIEIPSDITIAGEYRGENTFMAVISTATAW
jgi:hypothetical protein